MNDYDELKQIYGPVISSYTTAQAGADGFLIDISNMNLYFRGLPINIVTRAVWETFREYTTYEPATDDNNVARFLKTALQEKLKEPQYIRGSGDLFILPGNLWLRPNELRGWTLMSPEDN